jgi:hypothetical protein
LVASTVRSKRNPKTLGHSVSRCAAKRWRATWRTAAYLGCSFWTARDYVIQGLIPSVDMPPLAPRPGSRRRKTLRRVLIDRADLDAFIASRRRRAPGPID